MAIQYTENLILNLTSDDLDPSSEATDYEAKYLLSASPQCIWRTTGKTAESLIIDFGSAVAIDRVVLLAHNLSSGATITLKADDNSGFTSPESETLTWRDGMILKDFTSKTYRYWKLELADAGNTDAYLEIGNYILGATVDLDAVLPRGWERTKVDPSRVIVSASGKKTRIQYPQYWRYSVSFDTNNPAFPDDYDNIVSLIESVGAGGAFLISLKQGTDLYDHTIWADLTYNPLTKQTPAGHHHWGFQVEELL